MRIENQVNMFVTKVILFIIKSTKIFEKNYQILSFITFYVLINIYKLLKYKFFV